MEPKDDVIDYVKTNRMLDDIEDTWWEILRLPKVEGITVKYDEQEFHAKYPEFFIEGLKKDKKKVTLEHYEVRNLGYIKAVFGFWHDTLPKRYNGITIQRAHMPINQAYKLYDKSFEVETIPDSHKDRFYGIILLEQSAEKIIRNYEYETHYF